VNFQIDSPPTALHEIVAEETAEEGDEDEGEDYGVDVVHCLEMYECVSGVGLCAGTVWTYVSTYEYNSGSEQESAMVRLRVDAPQCLAGVGGLRATFESVRRAAIPVRPKACWEV